MNREHTNVTPLLPLETSPSSVRSYSCSPTPGTAARRARGKELGIGRCESTSDAARPCAHRSRIHRPRRLSSQRGNTSISTKKKFGLVGLPGKRRACATGGKPVNTAMCGHSSGRRRRPPCSTGEPDIQPKKEISKRRGMLCSLTSGAARRARALGRHAEELPSLC